MTYFALAYVHFFTVLPAFLIGTYLIFRRKGDPLHRLLGRVYLVLVFITALVSLCMPAEVGPRLFWHWGGIHLLSVTALISVVVGWRAAVCGDIRRHRNVMVGLYTGGMLVAGALALMPGRMLHQWLF